MPDDDADKRISKRRRRIVISLAVTLGIALFATGFMMTLISLSENSTARAGSTDESSGVDDDSASSHTGTLVIGLVLSMAGVVLATAVPAAFFIRSSKQGLTVR
jgi:hypothetical protein